MDPVNYVINSIPDSVTLDCPYCHQEINPNFDEVDFDTDYWSDGGWVTCPECYKEIRLGDYEYD